MLKKAAITKLAGLLKIDESKLTAAITAADEQDIEIPELNVFTKTELETRDKNQYDVGKKAGTEMTVKEIKKKHSLSFSGDEPDALVTALEAKIKAELDKNPDARITALQADLDTAKKALVKSEGKATQLEQQMTGLQNDTKLLSLLPNDRVETMSNEEYLTLLRPRIKIEMKDGKEIVIKDGQPVVNNVLEPIAPAEAIKGIFTERKWIKEAPPAGPQGRNGQNSKPADGTGKFTKVSEVMDHVAASGKNPMGEQGQAMVQQIIKDNPGIDLKS